MLCQSFEDAGWTVWLQSKKIDTFKHGKPTEKAISREINLFSNIWKFSFLDINEMKLFTKFEWHSVNGMAIIARKLTKYQKYVIPT